MRWTSALVAMAAVAWVGVAAARTVEGQRYDEQLTLESKPLVLNGAGVRQVGWFKSYTVGLWVPERSSDAQRVMEQGGPKRLRMAPLIDNIDSDLLAKALYDGVAKRVPEPDRERMMASMDLLARQIRALGKFRDTDVVDLDYAPAKGMQLRLNGQPKGDAVPGGELFAAILSIYIGEQPVDKKLKPALLGQ
jgi:hypothetical protein